MLNNSKLIKLLETNGYQAIQYAGDDRVYISGESGDYRVDYWNNYWTPELDELLTPKGHFAEWVNPGVMMVCEC